MMPKEQIERIRESVRKDAEDTIKKEIIFQLFQF